MVSIVLWGVSLCNARAWPTTTMLEEVWKWIQHCFATLRRSRNKRNIGKGICWLKLLTGFKLCGTTPNNTQQHTTTFNIVCMRTQHVTSNNAGSWNEEMIVAVNAIYANQDFNGVLIRDLAITGVMLYQLSYEATDVGNRSIVGWELLASNVPSVCTGLNVLVTQDVSLSCFVFMSQERAQTRERRA